LAKVTVEELKPAMAMCDYLYYGYVGIDDDKYKLESLDKDLDLEKGKDNLRAVTNLTKTYRNVQTVLSVGGFADTKNVEKYLKVLESTEKRGKFVSSAVKYVKEYGFQGLDLAWQFPVVKEKKERDFVGKVWHSVKSVFSTSTKDEHEKEHKDQFTTLCKELKAALRAEQKFLTLTILPHINHPAYFDVPNLKDSVDHITLMTYDLRTPERVPSEADYTAPLQYVYNRDENQNVEAITSWWLKQGLPAQQLILGIPTFGRTWKLTSDSGKTGVPPLKADGPGEAGQHVKIEGVLAYFELCPHLYNATDPKAPSTALRRVHDSTGRQGTYAYRLPKDSVKGVWVSYEDPEDAARKAQYAKLKGFGGAGIVDLTLDDYKGACNGNKYPILKAVKTNL